MESHTVAKLLITVGIIWCQIITVLGLVVTDIHEIWHAELVIQETRRTETACVSNQHQGRPGLITSEPISCDVDLPYLA